MENQESVDKNLKPPIEEKTPLEDSNSLRNRLGALADEYDSSISAEEVEDDDDEDESSFHHSMSPTLASVEREEEIVNGETNAMDISENPNAHEENEVEENNDFDDVDDDDVDVDDEDDGGIDEDEDDDENMDDSDDIFPGFETDDDMHDLFDLHPHTRISDTQLNEEKERLRDKVKMHEFSSRLHPYSMNDLLYASKCLGIHDFTMRHGLTGGLLRRKLAVAPEMVCGLRIENELKGHRGCVNALGFGYMQEGRFLVSGADDRCALIWDWAEAKLIHRMDTGCSNNVFQTKFIDNGQDDSIIVTSHDGSVRICSIPPGASSFTNKLDYQSDVTSGCNSQLLHRHSAACHKIAFPAGETRNVLLSCGEDCRVYERDIRESRSKCIAYVKQTPLYGIACHPFNNYEFSIAGMSPFVRVFDRRFLSADVERLNSVRHYAVDSVLEYSSDDSRYRLGKESEDPMPQALQDHRSIFTIHVGRCKYDITSIVYSCYGEYILASYNDEDIYLFDNNSPSGSAPVHHYYGHRNHSTVKGVNFYGAHSEYVISGGDDGFVYLWDRDTEALVYCAHGDRGGVVNVVKPHPSDHSILASSGLDNKVKLWRTHVDYFHMNESSQNRPLSYGGGGVSAGDGGEFNRQEEAVPRAIHLPNFIFASDLEQTSNNRSTSSRVITADDMDEAALLNASSSSSASSRSTRARNSQEIPSAKRLRRDLKRKSSSNSSPAAAAPQSPTAKENDATTTATTTTTTTTTTGEDDLSLPMDTTKIVDTDVTEVPCCSGNNSATTDNNGPPIHHPNESQPESQYEIVSRPAIMLAGPPFKTEWLLKKVATNSCERKIEQVERSGIGLQQPVWAFLSHYFPGAISDSDHSDESESSDSSEFE